MSSTVSIRLLLEDFKTASNIISTPSTNDAGSDIGAAKQENKQIINDFVEKYIAFAHQFDSFCAELNTTFSNNLIKQAYYFDNMLSEQIVIMNKVSDFVHKFIKKRVARVPLTVAKKYSKIVNEFGLKYAFIDVFIDNTVSYYTSRLGTSGEVDQIDENIRYDGRALDEIFDDEVNDTKHDLSNVNAAFRAFANAIITELQNIMTVDLNKIKTTVVNQYLKVKAIVDKRDKQNDMYMSSFNNLKPDSKILEKIDNVANVITGSRTIIEFVKKVFHENEMEEKYVRQIITAISKDIAKSTKIEENIIKEFFELISPGYSSAFDKFFSAPVRILRNFYETRLNTATRLVGQHSVTPQKIFKIIVVPALVLIDNIENIIVAFESYIKNIDVNVDKHATAGGKDVLGKIAFPTQRLNKSLPLELDTQPEKKLYSALKDHFDGERLLSKSDSNLIRKFLEKGIYNDVFIEPKTNTLVRGMTVPKKWLMNALKLKTPEQLENSGVVNKTFTFTPRAGGASWTTDLKTAKKFSREGAGDVRVIMYADLDKNPKRFVIGPGGLYNVSGLEDHSSERESIGLGPIKVSKIRWEAQNLC